MTSTITQASLIVSGLFVSGARYAAALVDPDTMAQLRGADGALFGSVIIVAALWLAKKADARRLDARHSESLTLQKENSQKLMDLQAESIKANARATAAIVSMDRSIQQLTIELADRPCQLKKE